MPVLDLASCVCGCENVTSFKILVFGSPGDVGKRVLWAFWDRNSLRNTFFLDVEYQNGAISPG